MKFKTSIPDSPGESTPQMGARSISGKPTEPESNLLGHGPGARLSEPVREAQEVKGAARKCIDIQVKGDGGSLSPNGDPHRRNQATWGVTEPQGSK